MYDAGFGRIYDERGRFHTVGFNTREGSGRFRRYRGRPDRRRDVQLSTFPGGKFLPSSGAKPAAKANPSASVELVPGTLDSLRVQPDVAERLGLKTTAALPAQIADSLRLSGTLTVDASHLQEVRSRFTGEVTEIGQAADGSRPIQFGDQVAKGQLLSVVWSRELGEKKSELVDALSEYHIDSETLKRLENLYQDGAIPEREYRQMERTVARAATRFNFAGRCGIASSAWGCSSPCWP
jgi:hypothetical protein